jgi:hypothetical protein
VVRELQSSGFERFGDFEREGTTGEAKLDRVDGDGMFCEKEVASAENGEMPLSLGIENVKWPCLSITFSV